MTKLLWPVSAPCIENEENINVDAGDFGAGGGGDDSVGGRGQWWHAVYWPARRIMCIDGALMKIAGADDKFHVNSLQEYKTHE